MIIISWLTEMLAREMTDLLDVLPYYLLVALPVFILLSPINPVDAASELDVHRSDHPHLLGSHRLNYLRLDILAC